MNGAGIRGFNPIVALLSYALALVVFILVARPGYSLVSVILAWILFVIGTLPIVVFISRRSTYFPVVETVMLLYANAFALPVLFESEHKIYIKTLYPDTEPVALTLTLVILAICTLWVGFKLAPAIIKVIPLPRLNLSSGDHSKLFYYGVILVFMALAKFAIPVSEFQGLVNIIANQDLAVSLLALPYYMGTLSNHQKRIIPVLLGIMVLNGISTSMTQQILQPLFIWFACRWLVTRKFEFRIIAIGVLAFVLIQPVKLEFRSLSYYDSEPLNVIDRLDRFSNIFVEHWFSSGSALEKVDPSTTNRTSLLLSSAHVVDWTPEVVPYAGGRTYYFMFVSLIPRFIWPDKPTAQVANLVYAEAYGVTTLRGMETTMFGVGHFGEAFMNFGAMGIVPVFLLIGMLYFISVHLIKLPDAVTSTEKLQYYPRHIASLALLVAVVVNTMFIDRTVADVFGGVVQLIVVQGGVMYFISGAMAPKRFLKVG